MFEFTDNMTLGLGTSPAQYLGEDLCLNPTLKTGEFVNDSLTGRMDTVDYGGVVHSHAPWLFNKTRRTYTVIAQGLSEVRDFREWLHRRSGRLKPFWMPTFENNLQNRHVGQVTISITVKSDDYILYSADRNHILITATNGATFVRAIIGSSDIGGGLISLGLDSFVGIDTTEVQLISFLSLYRLDSDRIEINWMPNYTLKSSFPIIEITP
jgi:hypothetical protein